MAEMATKPIDPRHRILNSVPIFHEASTKVYRVLGHPHGYAVNVHANCVCNENISLRNRHLVDRTDIQFDKKLWKQVTNETMKFYPKDLQPTTYEMIVGEYTGAKKRMYHNAMVDLRRSGLQRQHAVVKMFVKPDRYPVGDIGAKDPRAIQYRSPQFNLALGAYIKPFETEIYATLKYGVQSSTRVIAKGLNNYERAELLLEKINGFRDPRFVLVDHSRFDSTISVAHLRTTHRKYLRAFSSARLYKLLQSQINNKGYTKHGIKYRAKGTRMSGDCDTGCGNSIVNADCLYGFLTRSGVSKYDFILDGDDSVVIIEQADVSKLEFQLFERLGFKTKYDVVKDLDEVEFCQSKIILAVRPVFSRNPARAMSHSMVTRKRYPRQTYGRWIAAVGECERACNLGVPVLQAYGHALSTVTTNLFLDEELRYRWEQGLHIKNQPVTVDARASFALAWGVPWELQEYLEMYDWTATTFCSFIKLNSENKYNESKRLASITRRIQAVTESAPEFSGSCWWSCSQTRGERPGPGCV